jgi:IS5 family transposase
LLGCAKEKNIEKGRKARIDCTSVDSNIHTPTDSTLLWNALRALTRLIERCRGFGVPTAGLHNQSRVVKRRILAIVNANRKKQPTAARPRLIKRLSASFFGFSLHLLEWQYPANLC